MSDMRDLPQAELDVMQVLWRRGPSTVREVLSELKGDRRPAYTTVATLLNRLKAKNYVEAQDQGPALAFRPVVPREQVIRRKIDDLVTNVLGGDVAPLAEYIAENRKLSPKQIKALEKIIKTESKAKKPGG